MFVIGLTTLRILTFLWNYELKIAQGEQSRGRCRLNVHQGAFEGHFKLHAFAFDAIDANGVLNVHALAIAAWKERRLVQHSVLKWAIVSVYCAHVSRLYSGLEFRESSVDPIADELHLHCSERQGRH